MPVQVIHRTHSAIRAPAILAITLLSTLIAVAWAVPGVAAAQNTKKPSKLVELRALMNPGLLAWLPLDQIDPDGGVGSGFTVPAGQVLVVTSVTIPAGQPGSQELLVLALGQTKGGSVEQRVHWRVDSRTATHFTYPSGLVFGPGNSLHVRFPEPYTGGWFYVYANGYLAPDV